MNNETWTSKYIGILTSEQKDVRMFPPVPMVYEQVPASPLSWEYHVLAIDTRERDLPDTVQLNELGSEGWILVGVLNAEKHGVVHYYFARQKQA
jgi:hypothetical protein